MLQGSDRLKRLASMHTVSLVCPFKDCAHLYRGQINPRGEDEHLIRGERYLCSLDSTTKQYYCFYKP